MNLYSIYIVVQSNVGVSEIVFLLEITVVIMVDKQSVGHSL